MKNLTVVKLGGNAMDDPYARDKFLEQFAAIPGSKILVHGGGKSATNLGTKLGISSTMHDGRRVTDEQTLDVVTMVYAGLLNKKLVASLQSIGCNAIGLSGADGNLIRATKRSPIPFNYGFVGDPETVNTELLSNTIASGFVPVIAPITHDGNGQLLNTNADTIASSVATSLVNEFEVTLIFAFGKAGVLDDPDDEQSLVTSMNPEQFSLFQSSGKIHSGMLPKLNAGFHALRNKVGIVAVKHLHALNEQTGTQLTL